MSAFVSHNKIEVFGVNLCFSFLSRRDLALDLILHLGIHS